MSNNLDEIQASHSGIIKLKNPNLISNDKIKMSSDEFMSENELSEGNGVYKTGRWQSDEHYRFIRGCLQYGNNWKKVKECVKTRSSAQIRSHAQKYIIKLCKKFNIQDNKNLKSLKNIKRKMPSELMDDINWEKAMEWNGNENFESSNLNMEEIEEIILGIFKTNVNKNTINTGIKGEEKEKTQPIHDEKKIRVFETIKEPKNSINKKRHHRIHLHNQTKKADPTSNMGMNYNHFNNNNLMNLNFMNQLGLTDPHLQMLVNNNIMSNGMNLNMGNFQPNLGMNNNTFCNQMSLDGLLNGINFNLPSTIHPCNAKDDNFNKNNLIDNNFLNFLLSSNMNCMDLNNDEMLRNMMKVNCNNVNMNNLLGGIGNSNMNPTQNNSGNNLCNMIPNELTGMDNLNMFNDLVMNLLNPAANNNRPMMPLNEMMMQMYGNNQSFDMNNKNFGNNTMNSSNSVKESTNVVNNFVGLTNNLNIYNNTEKLMEETPTNHNMNTAKSGNQTAKNSSGNIVEEITDNLGDINKLQSLQQLAIAMKMFNGNVGGINSAPNELIANMPEMFSSSNIANLFNTIENTNSLANNNIQELNQNQVSLKETKQENAPIICDQAEENISAINPSKPNENLLSDDLSMMLINLLNSSNHPQLPANYDINSISQLFDIQNITNMNNNNVNIPNLKKHNDSVPNVEHNCDEKEKEESIKNKTQNSQNQNVNNNMQFNPNSNIFNNTGVTGVNNNMMNGNLDCSNLNHNLFQQQNFPNLIGDPLLGLVNQFFIQPNNMMPNHIANNLPLFNSKSQLDNYYFNNFNPMDLYFDPNMINQNNSIPNNKNNSD